MPSQNSPTHPENVALCSPVAGFLGDEGDGVVESVLGRTRPEACARGDAARNHHAGAQICGVLQESVVTCPEGPRQESVIHRQAVKYRGRERGRLVNKTMGRIYESRRFHIRFQSYSFSAAAVSFHHLICHFSSAFSCSEFIIRCIKIIFSSVFRCIIPAHPNCEKGAAGI